MVCNFAPESTAKAAMAGVFLRSERLPASKSAER